MGIISIISGVLLLIFVFVTEVKGRENRFAFKVIPFFMGVWNIYVGLYFLGATIVFK